MAQSGVRVQVNPKLVRPAMADHPQHPAQPILADRFCRLMLNDASDTTHYLSSFLTTLPEMFIGRDSRNSTCWGTL